MQDSEKPEVFKGIYTQKEKERMISKEYKRIKEIYENSFNRDAGIVDRLLHEAAFIAVTLQEAREIIIRDGIVENYMNGVTQFGTRKSLAVEVYDKYANTYVKIISQLCPKIEKKDSLSDAKAKEDIMNFARAGDKK